MECWQLGHNPPFLNARLKEEFYVKMAPGYEEFDANGISMLMWLHKRLYDLRKNSKLLVGYDRHLMKIGFKSLTSDLCVYIYQAKHVASGDVC